MTMRTIPEVKKIQMRKKKVNLVHHHNLKIRVDKIMNNITDQMRICLWTMKTVITKHKARNRQGRKSTKSQAPRKELQSSKTKLLCKHHQKLGSNMKGLHQVEVKDAIEQEVRNSVEKHQGKTIAQQVIEQESNQEH
eukprot:6790962-Ditylum_brightwellii.AAC.1